MLKGGNPFEAVIGEIDDMKEVITEEDDHDHEELDWCNDERSESHHTIDVDLKQMSTLEKEINDLKDAIEAPETGLNDMIAEAESQKATNYETQVAETEQRTKENLAYQADIKNLVAAAELVQKAIKVLSNYYDMLAKKLEQDTALIQ